MSELSEADVRAVFDSFDIDQSGQIDSKELTSVLAQLYGKDQAEKLAQVIMIIAY